MEVETPERKYTIESIPKGCLSVIIGFLDNRKDLNTISVLNKYFREFSQSNLYWNNVCVNYGESKILFKIMDKAKSLEAIKSYCIPFEEEEFTRIVEYVKESTHIRQLKLKYGHFSTERILKLAKALENHNSLTSLSLETGFQSEDAYGPFFDALMTNSTLKKLKLGYCFNTLGKDQALAMAELLKKSNTTLQVLSIESNPKMGIDGAKAIFDSLKVNRSLFKLNLNQLNLGDEGAKYLGDGLKENQTIKEIYFCSNKITSEGLTSLASGMAVNKSLVKLLLRDNEIKNEGITAFADMLKGNESLRYLQLSYNEIEADGAAALAEALKVNNTLTTLYFDENHLKANGVVSVLSALGQNKSLKYLDLSFDEVTDAGAGEVVKVLGIDHEITINLRGNDFEKSNIDACKAAVKGENTKVLV